MHGFLSGTTETGGPAAPTNPRPIPAATRLGAVQLTVRDLERLREFYERALGLRATDRADGSLALSGEDGRTLVELHGDSAAPVRNIRHPGLFHQAILFPTRRDLALALARLAAVRWPLDGASDHLVSEALYLSDPEGNGIELYRDRPREQWPHREGELQMATLPLDLDDLLGELTSGDTLPELVPPGTAIGHVHLQVSELRAAAAFFQGALGFEVTVGDLPGALFLSAGGLPPPHRGEHVEQRRQPSPRRRSPRKRNSTASSCSPPQTRPLGRGRRARLTCSKPNAGSAT